MRAGWIGPHASTLPDPFTRFPGASPEQVFTALTSDVALSTTEYGPEIKILFVYLARLVWYSFNQRRCIDTQRFRDPVQRYQRQVDVVRVAIAKYATHSPGIHVRHATQSALAYPLRSRDLFYF